MFFAAKTEADIDRLIANGKDINGQDTFFGQTFLHILVQTNNRLLDYFLEKGPDTNIQNKDGKTPIYYAKDVYTIEKLINHGASVLVKDLDNKTVNEANPRIMTSFITYYSNKLKSRLIA
jgi:hypothetical protein